MDVITQSTDNKGEAIFDPITTGRYDVMAVADGFAPAYSNVRMSASEIEQEIELSLKAGAKVSGKVVNAAGEAVAKAEVIFEGASEWGTRADERYDAIETNAAGEFTFDALPAGTFRFSARHKSFAPGSSELKTLDGKIDRSDVVIRLEEGATLSGVVVSKQGEGVPGARVRLRPDESSMMRSAPREAFTDDTGRFLIEGLPRTVFQTVAVHDSATSETENVDLTPAPYKKEVTFTLALDGIIAGLVVNQDDEPLEGAQVSAFPDFRTNGGMRSDFRLRGMANVLTDSGGHFSIKGLPDTKYKVRARPPGSTARGRAWLTEGVMADVGDMNVRVVLPKDGSIEGKVTYENGEAPAQFSVNIGGWGRGTSFSSKKGDFKIDEMPPKDYSLVIRGAGFTQQEIKVELGEGETKDLGSITVKKGRSVSGTIVDGNGSPVEGATVSVGKMIFGDGSSSTTDGGGGNPMARSTKTTQTDSLGAYLISGLPLGDLTLVADHPVLGRSQGQRITGTNGSVEGMRLEILKSGVLEGVVTRKGKPAENVYLTAASFNAYGVTFNVASGADGTFRFDRLAPDVYKVSTTTGNPMQGMSSTSVEAKVESDQVSRVELEIRESDIDLTVNVVDPSTEQMGMVWVTAIDGPITASNGRELYEQFGQMTGHQEKEGMSLFGMPAVMKGILPGQYQICGTAYPKGLRRGETINYMERMGENLAIQCVSYDVVEGANAQSVDLQIKVPEFVPPPAE